MLLSPALAPCCLVVFKSLTSVQLEPFHDSAFAVKPGSKFPPTAKAEVYVPTPLPAPYLAVFMSLTSVQLEPFHVSVFA